jgi:hypothetical protein
MKGHVIYMSLRTIEPGEEITVDYSFEYVGDKTPAPVARAPAAPSWAMCPKLERTWPSKKAAKAATVGRGGAGRTAANGLVESKGKLEPKAKSKAAYI